MKRGTINRILIQELSFVMQRKAEKILTQDFRFI